MSSAWWCVLNGRSMAPPGIGCSMGRSTSRKPRAQRHRHDPTREAHGLDPLQLLLAGAPQPLGERRRPVRHREAATERVEALRAQGLELLAPLAHEVVEVLAHQRAPPSAATGLTPGLP